MKKTLFDSKIRQARVLDTLDALTGKNTVDEQLSGLRAITAKDNVHLTDKGYAALAQGLVREARGFELTKQKGKGSIEGNARAWAPANGMVSSATRVRLRGGVFKAPLARGSQKGKFHPYQKKGGEN
jgi:hypothetical protein